MELVTLMKQSRIKDVLSDVENYFADARKEVHVECENDGSVSWKPCCKL